MVERAFGFGFGLLFSLMRLLMDQSAMVWYLPNNASKVDVRCMFSC
jgi:hypothetical protein